MKVGQKRLWIIGMLLLLLVVFTCSVQTEAAGYYNLIKDVSNRTVPEGQLIKSGSKKRYRLENGTYLKDSWIQVNGKIYHFNKRGYADTGWIIERENKYFLRASGALHRGGILKIKGRKYLFKYGYGMLVTGWRTIGGEKYYFRETKNNGAMIRSWWVDGKYLGADGKMQKNTWVGKYYVGADGERVKNAWVDDKYLGDTGKMLTDTWVGDFYVGSDGKKVVNTWVGDYYLGEDGKKVTNAWVGDKYLGPDGLVCDPPNNVVGQDVKRIFLGDSRTVGLYGIMTGDSFVKGTETQPVETQLNQGRTDIYIGKVGMGYDWTVGVALEELRIVLRRYPSSKVALRMGVNDLGNISNYITLYRNLIQEFPQAKFYVESVTPVDDELCAANGFRVTNKQILQFNLKLKRAFPSNYISSYIYVNKNKGKTLDGLHYDPSTYRMIYRYLDTVM